MAVKTVGPSYGQTAEAVGEHTLRSSARGAGPRAFRRARACRRPVWVTPLKLARSRRPATAPPCRGRYLDGVGRTPWPRMMTALAVRSEGDD